MASGRISPLKHQGIDGSKVLHTIHNLHDTRNLLTHCWFEPEHDGIEFEYFHPSGKDHPKFEARDKTYLGNFISYSELDSYDKQMDQLEKQVEELRVSLSKPITNVSADLMRDIEKIILNSENIVRFPNQPSDK